MTGQWEYPACPICSSRKYLQPIYTGVTSWEFPGLFSYLKCANCGLVLQSPRETFDQTGKYYPPATYWGKDVRQLSRHKLYGPIYKQILARKSGGSILDIGCGLGLFLSEFRDRNWQVLGTETSRAVAQVARKNFGVKVIIGDLTKLKIQKKFDVITLIGVFEHLYEPVKTLKIVRRTLKDDGLLVIVPPNFASLGRLIFGKKWYSLEPGRHVYHYTPNSITKILATTGFKVTGIDHHHWEHNYYGLFTSFRFAFSPKYQPGRKVLGEKSKTSWIVRPGVIAGKIFAGIGAIIEPVLRRGESMLVYAQKA